MGMFHGSINHTTSGRRKKKHGRTKKLKMAFRPLSENAKQPTYADIRMAEQKRYPSADAAVGSVGTTPRREPRQYTGSYIKGIATMHKSNAVPVTSDQQAVDISRMAK